MLSYIQKKILDNLNKFLQDNNKKGKIVRFGLEEYRVGDPIVFKESGRFGKFLYNNLKGTIIDIKRICCLHVINNSQIRIST